VVGAPAVFVEVQIRVFGGLEPSLNNCIKESEFMIAEHCTNIGLPVLFV
jgi:hypothetical protein